METSIKDFKDLDLEDKLTRMLDIGPYMAPGNIALSPEENEDNLINILYKGVESLRKEKIQDAITQFSKAIAINRSENAYLLRANTYYKNNQRQFAMNDVKEVLKINPECEPAKHLKALLHVLNYTQNIRNNKYKEADFELTELTNLRQHPDHYYAHGHVKFILNDYDSALEKFEKAKELGFKNTKDIQKFQELIRIQKNVKNYVRLTMFNSINTGVIVYSALNTWINILFEDNQDPVKLRLVETLGIVGSIGFIGAKYAMTRISRYGKVF